MASDTITVKIQNLAGTVEECEVSSGGTVSVLKDCVKAANLVECAPKHMSFSLMPESDNAKPVILDDSHTLASYGISDGDTVHVVATCDPYYKRTIVSPKPTDNYFYNGSIQPYDLCMSPDSKHLFVVDRARKCVHVYRSEDGAHVLKPKRAGFVLKVTMENMCLNPTMLHICFKLTMASICFKLKMAGIS